jgi:ribosomal protein S18 acetylase RimI-like enzyme
LIRRVEENDLDQLWALNAECYPEDDFLVRPAFNKVLRDYPGWVYVDNGIAAMLASEVSGGQPYVWSVATSPTHRGKGLATLLIKQFEKHYKSAGYDRAWLHVRVENPAQKLYFDLGYRVASFEANIYGPRLHGLVMRKRFV